MSPPRSLPRHRSDAWLGGFAIEAPVYTASISASGGTILAATERMYRLRPGATRFQWRDIPAEGHGDIVSVAVEPRRPGAPPRFAYAAFPNTIYLVDDEGVVPIELPLEPDEEITDLMWAACTNRGDPTQLLHVMINERVLRLLPYDGGPSYQFEGDFWPTESYEVGERRLCAMASDGDRGVAFAVYDEENFDIDVWVLEDLENPMWIRRSIETPGSVFDVRLAVAGTAVAVAFELQEGVWIAREPREPIVQIDALRGDSGVVAFGGTTADAPLFAAMRETPLRTAISRVDAEGRHERISEMTIEGDADEDAMAGRLIRQMAWDDTRRTLWCAAGRAGILCSTEPGSPPPLGQEGARKAPS